MKTPAALLSKMMRTKHALIHFQLFILHSSLAQSAFTEPPAVLYGKVVHIDAGSTYEVTSGQMSVTLTNENDASNSITLSTELSPSGASGQFSYRLDVPLKYLPSQQQKNDSLSTGETSTQFQFSTITIDGVDASPVDTAQSLLTTSFSHRAQEHRLDLAVTLPQLDSDDDGMPDWWENQHDLNPFFAGDATSDEDNDGWDALSEFNRGSNPTISNNTVTVQTRKLIAPVAGRVGLYFTALDSSDAPSAIQFTLTTIPTGFNIVNLSPSFRRLAVNDTFTYQDISNGQLFIEVPQFTTPVNFNFTVSDTESADVPFSLEVVPWSPLEMDVQQPALWLSANTAPEVNLAPVSFLETWQDSGVNDRDAYQPSASQRPFKINTLGGGGEMIAFGSNNMGNYNPSFMYLNDTGLELDDFTVFCRLSPLAFRQFLLPAEEQTILSLNDLKLSIAPQNDPLSSRSTVLKRNGSTTYGHSLGSDESAILTGVGTGTDVTMQIVGQNVGTYASRTNTDTLEPVFPSIGSRVPLSTVTPDQPFTSGIGDILLYDQQLDPQTIARIEDYLYTSLNSTLWDFSTSSTAIIITTPSFQQNIILGGWGNDQLTGNNQRDILRGGPGPDTLTGNASGDTFQIFLGDGNDIITDFDATSGANADRLDLRGLFSGKSGLPEQYLNLRRVIRHQAGLAPTIDTVVEIDLVGDGGEPDMLVTLTGLRLENTDLPRLVGEGIFFLGGPAYPVDFAIAANETALSETEYARTLTLTRSGNTQSAQQVVLGFTGSATAGTDYSLAQVVENGTLRTMTFAAGETTKEFDLTPIQDILPESETIHIAVLPSPQVPHLSESFASLTLDDAPEVKIEALVQHAQRLGKIPGVIKVSRTGDLAQPLDVRLSFDGTAQNGEDYQQVTPLVTFAANEQSKTINITPAEHALDKDQAKVARASLVPDTTQFATLNPWSASVLIVDQFRNQLADYGAWRSSLPPEFNVEGTASGDGDFIDLYQEYVQGLDATVADNPSAASIASYVDNGRFVMEFPTRTSLADVHLFPEKRQSDGSWNKISDDYSHILYPLSGDRIMHVYTSRRTIEATDTTGLFRINMQPTSTPSLSTEVGSLLNLTNQDFLIAGQTAGWIPANDGNGLIASPRSSGQTTILSTDSGESSSVTFDWAVQTGSGATVDFRVNGISKATLTDGEAPNQITEALNGDSTSHLEWIVTYGTANDTALTKHVQLQNIQLTP